MTSIYTLFCDNFHIKWIVLSTKEFQCYIVAKRAIRSNLIYRKLQLAASPILIRS